MIQQDNDFKLFCKYNLIDTYQKDKNDQQLIKKLKRRSYRSQYVHHHPMRRVLILMHGNYTCNANCIYCEHHLLRDDYKTAIMSEDIAEQVVKKLGPMTRELTWHGGEPTLLPESLIEKVEQSKEKYGVNFPTSLQTNAIALTPEKYEFFKSHNIRLGTSFDGIFNTRNRGENSTKAILNLLQNDPPFGFITVYIKDTVDYMIENYEYYKTLGVKRFQSCIVRENVIENSNPYLISAEKSAEKMLEYINYWIHDTNNPILDSYVTRQIKRLLGRILICEDGNCIRGWIIIDPYGNIGLCGQSQSENGIVNIKDIDDYNDLFYHPKFLSAINKQNALMKTCLEGKKCPWYNVCNGGCMGNNYECDSNYQTISERGCKYNSLLLEGIYNLIKDIDITRTDIYNPYFLDVLKQNCYFSLTEIKQLEEKING